MIKHLIIAISLSLPFFVYGNEWAEAAKTITYLSPREFTELPKAVSEKLVNMGCRIPQPSEFTKSKSNVIAGSFAKRGQKDYAVLCSRNGKSHIQVIWGGPQRCASRLQFQDDLGYMQGLGEGVIGYSRAIGVASQRAIANSQRNYGGAKPANTKYSGIYDAFIEKASTVFYCANGKWSELAGSD
jgi:hypothetical protein